MNEFDLVMILKQNLPLVISLVVMGLVGYLVVNAVEKGIKDKETGDAE